ncbi:MAG: hypothetical protein CMP61_12020 [Flavobacteriales bacterium]|nr:hypothetical protein [Flavobacteriales bacterium]|tara:strand:- start:6256 stop:7158 length:903 start_codon:yes stop_codon:yes gene_type:complete
MKKLFYALAIISIVACGDENVTIKPKEIEADLGANHQEEERIVSQRTLKELKNASKVVYTLPSPVEMADILHKTSAVYDVAILNDPNSISNYVTDFKRALNLGVYFADLSFTSMFDYPQDAMKFMGAAQAMSDELNIQGVYTEEVMMKLEDNLSNKDSLIDIVASAYMDTDMYLQDNERPIIAKSILAGAWLEGLYIAVNLKTEPPKESEVWSKIGEQKPAIRNLKNMLADCNEPQFDSLVNKLDELVVLFDSIKLEEISKDKSTESKRVVSPLFKVEVTEELFEKIQAKAIEVRNGIIQ